jgi:hypothetical protein
MPFFKVMLIGISVILISSCKRKDTLAPRLELNSDSEIIHPFRVPFDDPGVQAFDDHDCDLDAKVVVSGNVDVNHAGNYTLQYHVQDDAGNETILTRNVKVVFDKTDYHSLDYDAVDSCSTGVFIYNPIIQNCTCDSSYVDIINLSNFGPSTVIRARVTGEFNDSIIIDKSLGGLTFLGGGQMNSAANKITFNYTISDTLTTDTCYSVWSLD